MAGTGDGALADNWLVKLGLKILTRIPPLHRFLNRRLINRYAYATRARPRPFSMNASFTCWRSLTDRRFSGRHLPEAKSYNAALPPIDDVLPVFERSADRRATDTSLLFPFFAQWFTDSFLRTKWKRPEEQDFAENESNHEIDLCQIYGVGERQTTLLRAMERGRLKSQTIDGAEFPAPLFVETEDGLVLDPDLEGLYTKENFDRVFQGASDLHKRNAFAVGLEHGNSTMGNTLMNILFHREHNRIVGILERGHPDWTDERLFQTARNVCIVVLLKIVISDYIAHIAPVRFPLMVVPGLAEKERWYRTNWIAVEFALLYRWHDLIPSTVSFGGETRDSSELRRNNAWLTSVGVGQACVDASKQLSGKIGLDNTPGFLLNVRKTSLNMARTCALAPYNEYRKRFGKEPIGSFADLTKDSKLAGKLQSLYGSIDNLEWFVGIFAEAYGESHMMGELMLTMVGNDAFTQALTNPLLAEAIHNADTFSEEGLAILEATNELADVVLRNTEISEKSKIGFRIRS